MQIWFFFEPGVGGDGITNLIERSNNFVPYDGVSDWWRIHRIVDNKPKFYAPTPDTQGCFRFNKRFKLKYNQVNAGYANCINQNQNCVVASHDVTLEALEASDCQDIFCRDQIKVLLINNDKQSVIVNATTKNLIYKFPSSLRTTSINQSKFDIILDVNKLQTDWKYLNNFCCDVGIDLNFEQYRQYQDLLKGSKTYMKSNFNVEEYMSVIEDNNIKYTLVNVWQSTANKSIQ